MKNRTVSPGSFIRGEVRLRRRFLLLGRRFDLSFHLPYEEKVVLLGSADFPLIFTFVFLSEYDQVTEEVVLRGRADFPLVSTFGNTNKLRRRSFLLSVVISP